MIVVELRFAFADRRRHLRQHGLGDHHRGVAVTDQEGDLGRGHPEVHRNRNGAKPIGRKEGLDELGPVQHQDQHPVAERDAATAQRTRER